MSTKRFIIIQLVLFICCALMVIEFLQPQDLFTNSPIYTDDYSLHYSECISTKRFLSTAGRCWGYDPFLLAGFPRGTLADADNKAWELFYFILSPVLGDGLAFKAYVILFLLIYPFFIYLAARNFDLTRAQSLTASFLTIFVFHLTLANDFVAWGMVSYVFAVFFSLYILSAFYRLLIHFTWKRYLLVTISLALLVMMHILSIVHIGIPAFILYLAYWKKMPLRQHVLILLIPIVAIAFNSYWIAPVIEFFADKTTRPENYEFNLQIKNVFEPLKVYIEQRKSSDYGIPVLNNTFIDAFLLVFSWCGFYVWYKKRSWCLIIAFISAFVFMFGVAFYGSHTAFFAQLQPERFTTPLNLLLIIPASIGVYVASRDLLKGRHSLSIIFILCIAGILLWRPAIKPFIQCFKSKPYQVSCMFPDKLRGLLAFLEQNTNREGRILLEDSESPIHAYYGGHFLGLFPEHLQREYLCGPRPMYPIKHSYASFTMGVLFEKDIHAYTAAVLKERFKAYNIKWIVCWLKESKDFFEQFPDYIIKLADIDKFTVYEVKRPPSFFIKGSGRIRSDYNRLELNDIKTEDNEIIIAYHWMKYLKATPNGTIEQAFLSGDPIGFIRIKDPPPKLVIVNAY